MKQVAAILGKLLVIAQNTKTWLKVIMLILVCGGTFIIGAVYYSKTKVQKQDCTSYIEENKLLINALIDIKKDVQSVAATSYIMDTPDKYNITHASYDSVPKKKVKQQTQEQIKMGKIATKIDSIIYMYQLRQKSKQ